MRAHRVQHISKFQNDRPIDSRTLEDAALKLREEREVALAIFVPGHRRLEITGIGQAIGTFIEELGERARVTLHALLRDEEVAVTLPSQRKHPIQSHIPMGPRSGSLKNPEKTSKT